jgi:hypothetical protein
MQLRQGIFLDVLSRLKTSTFQCEFQLQVQKKSADVRSDDYSGRGIMMISSFARKS